MTSGCSFLSRMQQHTPLEQRESSLSIRTAFDPFHFIDESLHHAVAPGLGAAIGHGLRIVGKSVDKTDQFRDATGQNGCFPDFLDFAQLYRYTF